MSTSFQQLLKDHPWPDVHGMRGHDFTLGGGGRELVERELSLINKSPKVMLEIGCFMCASTRRWLNYDPDLLIVGVDPWEDSMAEHVKRYVDRPLLNKLYPDPDDQQQFVDDIKDQGPMQTGLANLAGFANRFAPVRDFSPAALPAIKQAGITPDIIYIDGAKQIEDLEECFNLWPDAKITGDDWHWGRTHGYPMRKVVKRFAKANGFEIEADWATWVLHKQA